MSTTTEKLALFKYDPSTDGAQTFNIKQAMNDNWDKIDDAVKDIDTTLQNKLGGIESTDYPGCYYRTVDGVVEWFNPPMQLGVEYRITERYQGKPVYAKDVDCGVASETGYIIAYPVIDNIESVIEAVPMVGSGTLPVITGSTANYEVIGAVQSYQVDNKYAATVIEHNGNTTNSVIVRLRYTKTTD